jgi:hypothetical protein
MTLQPGLLDQWTQFLIQDSLVPAKQISADDFAGALANQTNLAIKGMVGIKVMSAIHSLLGNTALAASYAARFQGLDGWSPAYSHLTLDVRGLCFLVSGH